MAAGTEAWLHKTVPYKPNANRLQTVQVWLPPAYEIRASALWVVYIHGGAWRDPLVLADSFSATVSHLEAVPSNGIAGIASINYSLSPHPQHPTHPSPPKNLDDETLDKSRVATHPDHIFDVLTALEFLQDRYRFGSNYVLIGHSCGAALALQVAMHHKRWIDESWGPKVAKPKVIVGLNGLYHMPKLIREPGSKHEKLAPLYTAFTKLAFGSDEKVWYDISPASVEDWAEEWEDGKQLILAQSLEDNLVPYAQTGDMLRRFEASQGSTLTVREVPVTGDHNFLWQDGKRLAEIVMEAVNGF